ncbi:hypothetical protein E3P99_01553 [Wallemia hederae]|uniref:Gfd2/YDR514C-like C-terminal domain-containing protein n=1 Tax=Wallemia hederae TaxID=1540922 RepID=A0A4V4LTQ7_9BASI|nr:hypothetical protein E3P99_01553 [Wallemia hederae]
MAREGDTEQGIHGLYKLTGQLTCSQWTPHVKHDEARTILKEALKGLADERSYIYTEGIGIELKIAIANDGSKRFLIPSQLIEYLRYRLCFENELNVSRLPLPSSESFIDVAHYVQITPTAYTNASELSRDMRLFHRHSKAKKKAAADSQEGAASARDAYYEHVRTDYVDAKKGLQKVRYVAIDVESWELDHRVITELGYSQLKFEDEDEIFTPAHIVIADHTAYNNGNYVVDNKWQFKHGKSETLSLRDTRARLRTLLTPIDDEKVVMVLHGAKNDLLSLDILLQLTGRKYSPQVTTYTIPTAIEVEVLDTKRLLGCMGDNLDGVSLIDLCRILKLSMPRGVFETRDYYHNAGNDAYATLGAFKRFAGGLALERHREQLIPSIQAILTPPVEEEGERMEDVL